MTKSYLKPILVLDGMIRCILDMLDLLLRMMY